MSTSTNISWTDRTDNIIRVEGGGWWCRKISPGCANCYAAELNQNSWYGGNKLPYTGKPPKLVMDLDLLASWSRQTKPKKHFVASMTDVFGDWVEREWIFAFLDAMHMAPKQTFQVLTKRADVMVTQVFAWLESRKLKEVPPNIWLGVSTENQCEFDSRVELLGKLPCAVRFVSMEPLLEFIDFGNAFEDSYESSMESFGGSPAGQQYHSINWVIVGGESGKKARACHVEWIRSIVKHCQFENVPCFVKQLGKRPFEDGKPLKLVHPKGGDTNEWAKDLVVQQFPK